MDQLTSEPCIRDDLYAFATEQEMSPARLYQYSAVMVVIGEFFAAAAFIIPKLRVIGLFVVPWFHVGVELLGFDIEWFSYYMIGINLVLLSPAALWRQLDGRSRQSLSDFLACTIGHDYAFARAPPSSPWSHPRRQCHDLSH